MCVFIEIEYIVDVCGFNGFLGFFDCLFIYVNNFVVIFYYGFDCRFVVEIIVDDFFIWFGIF